MVEMSDQTEFVGSYSDLSTDRGFQFEFNCDRCSHAYRTRYKPWTVGSVSSVLDAAGSLLGGMFGSATDLGARARSAGWQKAHDDALAEAVEETRGSFIQCPRCNQWVCRKACWNTPSGLCKECAPDRRAQMSAAQASRSVEEAWAHPKGAEEARGPSEAREGEAMGAACPKCGTPRAVNAKFCPECGTKF
jgi:membrane protease subunit (stomatin/prohibitin family)